MQLVRRIYDILKPLLIFMLLGLLLLMLFRIGLMVWQFERIDSFSTVFTILFNGLRIDLSTLAYLLIIPGLIHSILCSIKKITVSYSLLRIWFLLLVISLLFFEMATPTFILEYDLRPNRLFVEYLIYPKEVSTMLMNGHLLSIIVLFISIFLGALVSWNVICRFVQPSLDNKQNVNLQANMALSVTVAVLSVSIVSISLFGLARGTIGHRPLNPSLVYFSTDPLINSLTLNSMYSVAFAIKQLGNEINASEVYGNLSEKQVIEIVRGSTGLPASDFISEDIPTLHRQIPVYKGKPKNLVIVLEESLGAQFVGHLGGKGITPKLDTLMQQGWSFNNLYATGTRSVRGIEAVITGFTPTPARSVVKLDKSQHNFFTIASLLEKHNYTTQFIYGGESHFDNMKGFFLGNGFNSIIDFDDIKEPGFVASWGACDASLFNQANIELNKLNQSGKPFFSLIFTSSNHDPFEIPDNKVPIIEGEDDRDRAIRFADYALGNFIETAKQSDYWDNTVFLIVADHDARVLGAELVPVKSFHIPGVILGKDIQNRQDNRLVSQIDLAPTLLSLIGIDDQHPMIGHDLNKNDVPERAIMQFAKNFAYMTNERVAILQPDKQPMFFKFDKNQKRLTPDIEDPELGMKALGHALFGSKAYEKNWYRL